MRALTIRQPWASLIALGAKTIETRSWRAPASLIGQHFAIHAGAKVPQHLMTVGDWSVHSASYVQADVGCCELRTLHSVNRDGTLNPNRYAEGCAAPLPLGAIVATARLVDCVPIENLIQEDTAPRPEPWGSGHYIVDKARHEPYGDFTPGRWAWLLDDVKPTTERCPACIGKVHPTGLLRPGEQAMGRTYGDLIPCPQCFRAGTCPPIPAKGRQGLWTWAP